MSDTYREEKDTATALHRLCIAIRVAHPYPTVFYSHLVDIVKRSVMVSQ